VADRIVDILEAVEVEHENGEAAAETMSGQERLGKPLAQQRAVGQVGQRIVHGDMSEAGLGAAQLGDVLERGDPPAVGGGLVHGSDDASVAQLLHVGGGHVVGGYGQARPNILLGIAARVDSAGDAVLENLAQGRARLHLVEGQTVHLGIATVADGQPLLAVEHADGLLHVLERGVEALVLLVQLRVPSIELGERGLRPDARSRRPLQVLARRIERLGVVGCVRRARQQQPRVVGGNGQERNERGERHDPLDLGADQDLVGGEVIGVIAGEAELAVMNHGGADQQRPAQYRHHARGEHGSRMEPQRTQRHEPEQQGLGGRLEDAAGGVAVDVLIAPDQGEEDGDVGHVEHIEHARGACRSPRGRAAAPNSPPEATG
jgi:hypothetical protein